MASLISRATRGGFAAIAVAAIAVLSVTLPAAAVQAATPAQQLSQVPGYYRMVLGDFEITAVYDGSVRLDPAILKGASKQTVQKLLARHFIPPTGGMPTAVNTYLVHTGSKLVLVDAGGGHCFGSKLGHLPGNIRAAGYTPAQVDAVLITHLHADHVCGLVNADGVMVYPNAEVWVSQAEADYWLSDKIQAQAAKKAQSFFETAQSSVEPYIAADQFNTFSAGAQLMPGIFAVAAAGHTPGHTAYLLDGPKHDLLIWGDIVHSLAVQFPRPEVAVTFDSNSLQAIKTRKRLLARAAKQELWVAGAHLPFPGIGHIRAQGDGYVWVPVRYHPVSVNH